MKRILGILLVLFLAPVLLAPSGAAAESGEVLLEEVVMAESAGTLSGPSNASLADGYARKVLYPERSSRAARNVGETLTGADRLLYDCLKRDIEQVAAGSLDSTKFEYPLSDFFSKLSYSEEELGTPIVVNGAISADAADAVNALTVNTFNREAVIHALLADCPYDLYWFDKSGKGFRVGTSGTLRASKKGGVYWLGYGDNAIVTVTLNVCEAYALDYDSDPEVESITVNTEYGSAAVQAAANAQAIVAAYEGRGDYERLLGYKNEICDRVSYNDEAYESHGTMPYGDPWQLVWVFDDDPSTNVVCEGYAKAFKYLNDVSRSSIGCILVSGEMAGGTGAGPHMWNVVTMRDGKNYIADIGNCDTGTVGYPDHLFLRGPDSGTWDTQYAFDADGNSVTYEYDAETLALFSESELTLAGSYLDEEEPPMPVPQFAPIGEVSYVLPDTAFHPVLGIRLFDFQLENAEECLTAYVGEPLFTITDAEGTEVDAVVHAQAYGGYVTMDTIPDAACSMEYTLHVTWYGQENEETVRVSFTEGEAEHSKVIIAPAVPHTCTEDGILEDSYCRDCGAIVSLPEIDPAAHTPVADAAVDPTCLEDGLTEGAHCGVCGEVLEAQRVVPALGHLEVTDPAVDPTCLEDGLTEGMHCGRCGLVLTEQALLPALGHDWLDPVYTWEGSLVTASRVCSRDVSHVETEAVESDEEVTLEPKCMFTGEKILTSHEFLNPAFTVQIRTEMIPALGHIWGPAEYTLSEDKKTFTARRVCERDESHVETETVQAIPIVDTDATCTEMGYTSYVSDNFRNPGFRKLIRTLKDIPALGHKEVVDPAKEPTCTETGLTQGIHCERCEEVLVPQEVVPALGHKEVVDPAQAPTCTETGLTQGVHCERCEEVLVPQEVVPALGHAPAIMSGEEPGEFTEGWTEGEYCTVCNEVLVPRERIHPLKWEIVTMDDSVTILKYYGSDTAVVVPAELDGKPVTALADDSLSGAQTLYIPGTVTSLGEVCGNAPVVYCFAFSQADAWATGHGYTIIYLDQGLHLPSGLKTIEEEAFAGLPDGTPVHIPDGVETIADGAFGTSRVVLIVPEGSHWAEWAGNNGFICMTE